MAVALSNILPITFLSSFCFLVLTLLAYFCWGRAFPQRAGPGQENPEYDVEEIPGTTDFVMVGRKGHGKKVKKPKLWDIWVSNFSGRPTHERKLSSGSSFTDLSVGNDAGHWAELKPMTVTYVKCSNKTRIPPIPTPPIHPPMDTVPEPTIITTDGNALMINLSNLSQSSLLQPPSRDIPPGLTPGPPPAETLATELASRISTRKKHENMSGYDKSAIEAVQVSVFVVMPQRPTSTHHHTTAGPLELGVVHIPLGHSAPRWAVRQSIRPPSP